MKYSNITIERIYSGFLGYPFILVIWADGKIIGWSTNDTATKA